VSTTPTKAQLIRETRHGLVVRLRVEGLRYREISERVGLSTSSASGSLRRRWRDGAVTWTPKRTGPNYSLMPK